MRKVQKKPVKVVKELSESSSDDEDTSISEEAENVTNEKNILRYATFLKIKLKVNLYVI